MYAHPLMQDGVKFRISNTPLVSAVNRITSRQFLEVSRCSPEKQWQRNLQK